MGLNAQRYPINLYQYDQIQIVNSGFLPESKINLDFRIFVFVNRPVIHSLLFIARNNFNIL